ncbi:hypothetical protein [Celeribacter sp.]|uniref:hypothetical protein n=1 Tax=Celeribacter sp. TaxID=1890673 RepID=UPI003A956285
MKKPFRQIDKGRNAAGETPQEERRRKQAFDQWLKKQPMPSSQCFAMVNYGSMERPLAK